MKALVMCGGFAKRLGEIAKDKPKALLDVGGKPVLSHIVENLERTDIDEIIVSTNARYASQFSEWLEARKAEKPVRLVVEQVLSEEEKLGAIGGICFALRKLCIDDDLIVVNGDNIFDYEASDVIAFHRTVGKTVEVVYDTKSRERAKQLGVVSLEGTRFVRFIEKPQNPETTLVGTGFYIFPRRVLPLFFDYINEGNKKDASGYFIQWLHKRVEVHGFVHNGAWFDIGDPKALEEARKRFGSQAN